MTRRVSPFILLSSRARCAGGIRGTANLQYLAVYQSTCATDPMRLRTQANRGFLGIDPRLLWITSSSTDVHGARGQFISALLTARYQAGRPVRDAEGESLWQSEHGRMAKRQRTSAKHHPPFDGWDGRSVGLNSNNTGTLPPTPQDVGLRRTPE